jgi:hypothetical protein
LNQYREPVADIIYRRIEDLGKNIRVLVVSPTDGKTWRFRALMVKMHDQLDDIFRVIEKM